MVEVAIALPNSLRIHSMMTSSLRVGWRNDWSLIPNIDLANGNPLVMTVITLMALLMLRLDHHLVLVPVLVPVLIMTELAVGGSRRFGNVIFPFLSNLELILFVFIIVILPLDLLLNCIHLFFFFVNFQWIFSEFSFLIFFFRYTDLVPYPYGKNHIPFMGK